MKILRSILLATFKYKYNINYTHHAVHDMTIINLFCNCKFVPFEYFHRFCSFSSHPLLATTSLFSVPMSLVFLGGIRFHISDIMQYLSFSDLSLSLFCFVFFVFLFGGASHGIYRSDLSHSCDLHHSCGNPRSFNPLCWLEMEAVSWS